MLGVGAGSVIPGNRTEMGNIATEEVVGLCQALGFDPGVDVTSFGQLALELRAGLGSIDRTDALVELFQREPAGRAVLAQQSRRVVDGKAHRRGRVGDESTGAVEDIDKDIGELARSAADALLLSAQA